MVILKIPEELLREAGLDEREALIEFACRLFEAGKLSLCSAARLAGLNRAGMEDALLARNLAIFRPDVSDLTEDLETFKRLGV